MDARLPIVQAWLDRSLEGLQRIVEETRTDDPAYPYYRALWVGEKAIWGRISSREGLEAMRESLNAPPDDVELYLAILLRASWLMVEVNLVGEARRVIDAAKKLGSRRAEVEWKAELLLFESFFLLGTNRVEEAAVLVNESLALGLQPGSSVWFHATLFRLQLASNSGNIADAERDLADLKKYPEQNSRMDEPLKNAQVFLDLAQGKADEGLAVLDSIKPVSGAGGWGQRYWRARLLLRAGRLDEASAFIKSLGNNPNFVPDHILERLHTIEAMTRGDLEGARIHAQRATALSARALPQHMDASMRFSLEVELASRRTEAARLILGMLDKGEDRGDMHCFWARYYLLTGEDSKAAAHLKWVVDSRSPDVLREEFIYAHEVSAPELARLLLMATRVSGKRAPEKTSDRKEGESSPILGRSPAFAQTLETMGKLAPLDQTVLVTGETGTGKDVAARWLHAHGAHPREPWLPVNCAAVSDHLIEAELFGYVKGAFTGADRDHDGLFIAAGKGTLFLDEVGSMSLHLQAALLRTLENREVRPVGSTKVQPYHARIVAATSAPLEQAVSKGDFRSDLYYRLSVFHVVLPPLRERVEDIALLARHFLKEFCGDYDVELGDDLIEAMKNHAWPGNIRELKNEIQRMLVMGGGRRILGPDLFHQGGLPEGAPSRAATAFEGSRSTRARRERLKGLFESHGELTRADVVRLLECAPGTAVTDLQALEAKGVIRRVRGSASGRTSCFVKKTV